MAQWKPYRVSDMISEIEEEKFVLPVIQRRFVWEEEKLELLFDTLLKGNSFGGIMVIEEEKGQVPLFSFRPFTKDGNNIVSRQVQKLNSTQNFVIDGQQRLQTFYIGLKGDLDGKEMYFDLFSECNFEYQFKFINDAKMLPAHSKENEDRSIKEHLWYSVGDLYNRLKATNDEDQVSEEVIISNDVKDAFKIGFITRNIKAFYKNIFAAENIGVSKVLVNKSLQETVNKQRIVELFRRLNDGGTRLSSFELVASILKGFAWEMEGFLDETLSENQSIGLTQDSLIKLIFLLQDNHNKEMTAIEESDASFAIVNRERIKASLKALKIFMIEAKLADYYKEGNRSFIPLYFIAYHLFHKNIENNKLERYFDNHDTGNGDFLLYKKWITHSLLNGVFRSKGAGWTPYKTGIRKILDVIKNHKDKSFPVEELFDIYRNHPIIFKDKYKVTDLDDLELSFVFYLMYDKAQTVRIQDVDHIMPKSILLEMGVNPIKINSIRNYQLIDFSTNRGEKNGKAFSKWVNNTTYVKDKPSYIKRHLIPEDESLWSEKNFESFISDRSLKILEKIKQYL